MEKIFLTFFLLNIFNFFNLFYQMSNQKITFNTEIFSNNEDDKIIFTLLRNENNLYNKRRN